MEKLWREHCTWLFMYMYMYLRYCGYCEYTKYSHVCTCICTCTYWHLRHLTFVHTIFFSAEVLPSSETPGGTGYLCCFENRTEMALIVDDISLPSGKYPNATISRPTVYIDGTLQVCNKFVLPMTPGCNLTEVKCMLLPERKICGSVLEEPCEG